MLKPSSMEEAKIVSEQTSSMRKREAFPRSSGRAPFRRGRTTSPSDLRYSPGFRGGSHSLGISVRGSGSIGGTAEISGGGSEVGGGTAAIDGGSEVAGGTAKTGGGDSGLEEESSSGGFGFRRPGIAAERTFLG
jgi:hypothetical protein